MSLSGRASSGMRGPERRAWLLLMLSTALGAGLLAAFAPRWLPVFGAQVPSLFLLSAALWVLFIAAAGLAWRYGVRQPRQHLQRRLARRRAAAAARGRKQAQQLRLRNTQLRDTLRATQGLRTQRDALDHAHRQLQAHHRSLLATTQDALLLLDAHGRLVNASTIAAVLLHRPHDGLQGTSLADFREPALDALLTRVLADATPVPRIEPITLSAGRREPIALMVTAVAVLDAEGQLLGALLRLGRQARLDDARKADAAAQPPAAVPEWDAGLLSRGPLERRIDELIGSARSQRRRHVLLLLRLDGVAAINDAHGVWAGEQALWHAARQVVAVLGTQHAAYRHANNRLAILIQDGDPASGQALGERLRAHAQHHPLAWEGRNIACTISVALVVIDGSQTRDGLLSAAEALLAEARGRNGNCVVISTTAAPAQSIQPRSDELWLGWITPRLRDGRAHLLLRTARALQADAAGLLMEADMRIEGDDGVWLAPDYYLPPLERLNQSAQVDLWQLREALALLSNAAPTVPASATITLRLASASLRQGAFVEELRRLLTATPASARRICLYVDETLALASAEHLRSLIAQLKPLGLRFGLDGCRDSRSVAALRDLPVDYLRLHPRLTQGIDHDALDRSQLEWICQAARRQQRRTVATMVDTAAALEPLRSAGVDYASGEGIEG